MVLKHSLAFRDRKEMAESGTSVGGEDKGVEQEEKDEDNFDMINSTINLDTSTSGATTSSPLKELNLLIILSFLSLSPEECLDLEQIHENEENTHKDSRPRHPLSANLQMIRERRMYEFRAPERQSARFHTKVRDCRHFRRR